MTPAGWRDFFATAHTDAEVVAMANEFVSRSSAEELNQLSASCLPPQFTSADDVAGYAYILMRSNCEGDGRVAIAVHRFVTFFSEASIRLGELRPALKQKAGV